jgi:S-adenosylmethionine:tRNA ribosyltransferase-isomerase
LRKLFKENKYYQTIFAREKGSVAAPTAGFHFTQKLVWELKKRGVKFVFVTLHIGLGTFAPIRADQVEDHRMHAEYFELSRETADILNQTKKEGRRIVAVGTTATRVLENAATTSLSPIDKIKCGVPRSSPSEAGSPLSTPKYKLVPCSGETKIFITPGYKFKFIDALITNFHLPHSTPLLLAAAFCQNGAPLPKPLRNVGAKGGPPGLDLLLKAYKEAIKKEYRFYSFGDAMLIV